MNEIDDRDRVRSYILDESRLWMLLEMTMVSDDKLPMYFQRVIAKDTLPKDAKIVAINSDYSRRAFMLTLQSKEFEPVCPGAVIPIHGEYELESHIVTLNPNKEQQEMIRHLENQVSELRGELSAKNILRHALID